MSRKLLFVLCLLAGICSEGQQNTRLADSLKKKLSQVQTGEEKINLLGKLSLVLINTNMPESDHYGQLMNEEAERSRNRKLMAKALLTNGLRYSYIGSKKEYLSKSIGYYNQALELARQNDLDEEAAEALLGLSAVNLSVPDLDKALTFTTEASSLVSTLNNDSMRAVVLNSFGNVYQIKKNRLLALRNYLNALHIAEDLHNNDLQRSCYRNLMAFYADIKEFDKSIDFAQKALDQLAYLHRGNEAFNKVVDLFYIGNLYVAKKNFDLSVSYFEQSIALADSLKYEPLKMPAYQGLLGQYMDAGQPEKALAYLNNRPDLKSYILQFGMSHAIDRFYAVIYRDLGKYDSAGYYFNRAAPLYEATGTPSSKIEFYYQFADLYKRSGNNDKAIIYYTKASDLANQTGDLEWQQDIAQQLDTIYARKGDYRQSYYYSGLFHQYKDSLQKQGAEKDMMQMEIADEQQRQERKAREEAAALERRHNVEYMGITITIAIIFLLLVVMGAFRVSVGTIKVMGFFAFILLFEFIILLADTRIHEWTHGEPLKVLGIKIVLIAMLLPLHHWLEHRVVNYLASRRLIIPSGKNIWTRFRTPKAHEEH